MPRASKKEDPEIAEKEEVEVEVVDTEETTEPQQTQSQEQPVETAEEPVAENKQNTDEELEQYSEGVQKRISKLTAKMREAQRREQAALQFAEATKRELEETQKKHASLDSSFVQEFENRVNLQDQFYKSQLKEAIDRGDVDAQVEAQKQLAQVASQTDKLNVAKQQQEALRAHREAQPQVAQPQAQQPAPPDPKAQAWAARNEWFGQDEPMTLTAFSMHKNMVENEGYDPHSDEYYTEIDRRIRAEFPQKFNGGVRQTGPAVASANRAAQKKGKQKIQLTKSEVAIADKLGVSYEQYARQKARMINS